ncbi:hypothetical protein ACFYMO_00690 [Streptomyces sp. NPDC007025]|uniref:hypothetical protein n=1 Tax=Streptomyces sp. NPDC007025 TaxID=3364771 RepID=UPI0036CBC36B
MSDFGSVLEPENHVCDHTCLPYAPIASRNLESMEESEHIDALYEDLNLVREHAALLLLAIAEADAAITIPARTAAALLDLDEEGLREDLGGANRYSPAEIRDQAIRDQREDGYVGRAMEVRFKLSLEGLGSADPE